MVFPAIMYGFESYAGNCDGSPGLHALPRSKPLRFMFSSTPNRLRWLGLCFESVPGPSSSGDQVFGERSHPQLKAAAYRLPRPSCSVFWVWELDYKEGRELKNWCFQTIMLEETVESPLDSKESNQSILKKINPDVNSWVIRTDPDAMKDWRQRTRRWVGWHHQFSGHELGQTLGNNEGQGSLTCCNPWGFKESVTTWWLSSKNNNNKWRICGHISYS